MLIPATAVAPTAAQARSRALVTPPNAATGMSTARHATRSPDNPGIGPGPCFGLVGKTGPKTAKSAPSRSALRTSSTVCVDTPMENPAGTIGRNADTEGALDSR